MKKPDVKLTRFTSALVAASLLGACGESADVAMNASPTQGLLANVADATVLQEGNTSVEFAISLNRVVGEDITINFATRDGSATGGQDYEVRADSIVIPAGSTSAFISVGLLDDLIDEPDEDFYLDLSAVSEGGIGVGSAMATIRDDDASPVITLIPISVDEGTASQSTLVSVMAELSVGSQYEVTVDYATLGLSASAPEDFLAASGTLVFTPGEIAQTIDIDIVADSLDEVDETFRIQLSNPFRATINNAATITIVDDDGAPSLAIADAQVVEGDAGATELEFTASINTVTTTDVSFNYQTVDGSANQGVDYLAASGQVTIPAGSTSASFSLDVLGDTVEESDETFSLTISNVSGAQLAATSVLATILDDDTATVLSQLSVADVTVVEGTSAVATTGAVIASLNATSDQPITADFQLLAGSATAGSDYVAAQGQLQIPIGATQASIPFEVVADSIDEPDETLRVVISNAANATVVVDTATITIGDDDQPPGLSVADATVAEGDSGSTTLDFPVSLSAESGFSVTVDFQTADGTAAAGSDYVAQTGQVTFPVGTTSQVISIVVTGDAVSEASETLALNLSNPVNADLLDASAVGTIANDDGVPTLSIADATVTETDSGTQIVNMTITLSQLAGTDVDVNWATQDGSATAGSDYVAAGETITIPSGSLSQQLSIVVNGDIEVEPDESLSVVLSAPLNATIADGTAVLTIVNDDTLPGISIGDIQIAEGNAGTTVAVLNVTLSEQAALDVSVDFATNDDTAVAGTDYASTSGTLTIPAGLTSGTIDVSVFGDVIDEEDTEVFTVALTNPVGTTLSDSSADVEILDDDAVPTLNEFGVASVLEAEGLLVFELRLDNPSARTITVNYATQDGTADSADYTGDAGTLSFAPGITQQSIDVVITDDALDEGDETVLVNLSSPDANVTVGNTQLSGLVIDDDGTPNLLVVGTPPSLESAGTHVFTVSLSNPASADVTVDFATSDGTAIAGSDYVASSGSLTFTVGDTEETVSVTIIDDSLDEADSESLTLTLSNAVNANLSVASTTGEILDDDAPVTVGLVGPVAVTEGNAGTADLVFTVALSSASGRDVSVGFIAAGQTALTGVDFQAASGTLNFAPGDTSATLTVSVIGDLIDEVDETLEVMLNNPTNATIGTGQAVGTITDDDSPPAVSIADSSVTEGDSGTVTLSFDVSLNAASGQTVMVDYATVDATATAGTDYVANSGSVSFEPGQVSRTLSIQVIGDTVFESDETLGIVLSNPTNATLADGDAVGTIVENDAQPVISLSAASGGEGTASNGTVTLTATLTASSTQTITADFATSDDTAVAGVDYAATSGTLTFTPGDTVGNIPITLIADAIDEADETFTVSLSNIVGATAGTVSAQATIVDDDASPSLSINDVQVSEGDTGQVVLRFTVSLSESSGNAVSVDAATVAGTAEAGVDFDPVSTTLNFAVGGVSQTLDIPVNGDTLDENDETFSVTLSGATNATISDGSGTGTIVDNDNPPVLSIADASTGEGDSGTANLVLNVTLSAASGKAVTVDYATADGTAEAGSDYTAATATVTFNPGQTMRPVTILVIGDNILESDEAFNVTLSGAVDASIGDADAIASIVNDDATPSLSVADVSVVEGDAGSTPVSLNVSLSNPSDSAITVDYATADGTATSASDYSAASGALTIPALATSATIALSVNGDGDDEPDENFSLTLSSPVGATISDGQATVTVTNDDTDVNSGLDSRPSNTTCLAPAQPTDTTSVTTSLAYPSLPAQSQLLHMLQRPGDDSRWYVVRRTGQVVRFQNTASASSVSTVIDLSGPVNSSANETGLLGMAFHPNFSSNGEVYFSYTITGTGGTNPYTSVISRFTSNDGGDTIDPGSEEILLTLEQRYNNHNGGNIAFGPDGYLYIGFGDSGSGGDPGNRSQNTGTLHGSLLRIDVDNGSPYGIPSDNPFSSEAICNAEEVTDNNLNACPETYAWGLRNPWRWSFDTATGDLWLADVGQNAREEVNIIELGGNYGWKIQEGTACFSPSSGCDNTGLVEPVVEYSHSLGQSITGGYVYRGDDIPELTGRFIFGDFVSGRIWAVSTDEEGNYGRDQLQDTSYSIASFAQDQEGEVYLLNYANGRIRKLVAGSGSGTNTIPDNLVDTGCVDSAAPLNPASGLIPYETIARFWSDDAVKDRYYAIPDATQISVDTAGDGDWDFPNGSVIVKNFDLAGQRIETRLFMRHTNGEWAGYTYEWNNAETVATRVVGGKTREVNGQTWIYPSEGQCMQCHTAVAGFSLGLENAQLNKDFGYPSPGTTANQLVTADAIDVIAQDLGDVSGLPTLTDPTDGSASLEDRARAYLHTNCAQCHQPGGPTPTNMDLRWTTALASTNTCDVDPGSGDLDFPDPKIIDPGDSANSMLVVRISRRDVHGMPPIGTNLVDTDGVALLSSWINGLSGCP